MAPRKNHHFVPQHDDEERKESIELRTPSMQVDGEERPRNDSITHRGTLNINALQLDGPERSRIFSQLHRMDTDGDGEIDMTDVLKFVSTSNDMSVKHARMKQLFITAVLFAGFLLGLNALATIVTVNRAKDTSQADDVMVVKNTDIPIQTANYDMDVSDGVMMGRQSKTSLAVGQAVKAAALSSQLSDTAFETLKTLKLTSKTGASLSLNVLGWMRLPASTCHGTVVQLITAAGTVVLDGAVLSFNVDVSHVFRTAGFTSVSDPMQPGRRLLSGLANLIGLFNFVGRFDETHTFDADEKCSLPTTSTFVHAPDRFSLHMRGYTRCLLPKPATDAENTEFCLQQHAVKHSTLPGLYFVEELNLWQDSLSKRTKMTQTASWDAVKGRMEIRYEDGASNILKTAHQMNGQLFQCALSELPDVRSIFDTATAQNAQRIDVGNGETAFVVDMDVGGESTKYQLRIWQGESAPNTPNTWRRIQVWDRAERDDDVQTIDTTSYSTQKFFEVSEMIAVTAFPENTFKIPFPDTCAAQTLPKLTALPHTRVSDAYVAWTVDHPHMLSANERDDPLGELWNKDHSDWVDDPELPKRLLDPPDMPPVKDDETTKPLATNEENPLTAYKKLVKARDAADAVEAGEAADAVDAGTADPVTKRRALLSFSDAQEAAARVRFIERLREYSDDEQMIANTVDTFMSDQAFVDTALHNGRKLLGRWSGSRSGTRTLDDRGLRKCTSFSWNVFASISFAACFAVAPTMRAGAVDVLVENMLTFSVDASLPNVPAPGWATGGNIFVKASHNLRTNRVSLFGKGCIYIKVMVPSRLEKYCDYVGGCKLAQICASMSRATKAVILSGTVGATGRMNINLSAEYSIPLAERSRKTLRVTFNFLTPWRSPTVLYP